MRTLLVVVTLVTATLPLGKANHAPSVVTAHEVQFCDGGPDEPIPVPTPPRRA